MKKFFVLVLCLIITLPLSVQASKPIIGITSAFKNNKAITSYDYVKAIEENGGIPLVLPDPSLESTQNRYLEILDGVLLTGGADIPPSFYGQKKHPTTHPMDDIRFNFDKSFVKKWWDTGKPMLGICLGMQITNVIRGGTMFQDIPSLIGKKVTHRQKKQPNYHSIGIAKGSLLAQLIDKGQINVLSRHHQAVDKIGKDLKIIARSTDGVVEAMQRTDGHFGLFLQFHPEGMKEYPIIRSKIFKAFINKCNKHD